MTEKKTDPLKDKLDALSLAILNDTMTNEGKLVEALPMAVHKAMDVIKTVGGWYAIKNKVNPETNDEEGKGINEFKSKLAGASDTGIAGGPAIAGATTAGAEPERDPDPAATERTHRPRRTRAPTPDDDSIGGAELAGLRASIPPAVGRESDGKHGARRAPDAARSDVDRGGLGVADADDAGGSDLDRFVH